MNRTDEREYIGTQEVHAWPQEKQGKPGYGVKYEDGYISWSPKDIFDAAYHPVNIDNVPLEVPPLADTAGLMASKDYKERFKAEVYQLANRRDGLDRMLMKWDNGTLDFKPTCPREIYNKQIAAMNAYLNVLAERARLEGVEL
jgi:hypothetical protein